MVSAGPSEARGERLVVATAESPGQPAVELHRDRFQTDKHAAAQQYAMATVMAFVALYGAPDDQDAAVAQVIAAIRRAADQADALAASLGSPADGGGRLSADDLIRMVEPLVETLRDPMKEPYVRVRMDADGRIDGSGAGPRVTTMIPVDSEECKDLLRMIAFNENGRGLAEIAVAEAQSTLRAKALFGSPEEPVHIRVAWVGTGRDVRVYLDLADGTGRAAEVRPGGWSIASDPAVNFYRPPNQWPLPEPAPPDQGDVGVLRSVMNVGDAAWTRVVLWMFGTLLNGPFPLLYSTGAHGSGKSTVALYAAGVTDPQDTSLLGEPGSQEDVIAQLRVCRTVVFDNLRTVKPWFSDLLCRIATGGAIVRRKLYTNFGLSRVKFRAPVALAGIAEVLTAPDAMDRCLVVRTADVTGQSRLLEEEVAELYEAARPVALAGLLNGLAAALKAKVEGRPRPKSLPRMADFAMHCYAAEEALGLPKGAAQTALEEAAFEAEEAVLDGFPAVRALMDRFQTRLSAFRARNAQLEDGVEPEPEEWRDTPTAILSAVSYGVRPSDHRDTWPKTAQAFRIQLDKTVPLMRRRGVAMTSGRGVERWIAFREVPPGS